MPFSKTSITMLSGVLLLVLAKELTHRSTEIEKAAF